MKTQLLVLLLAFAALTAKATPGFSPSKRYHIVCTQFSGGCVIDGASANQSTPLYHLQKATTDDATFWLITEQNEGLYYITNAMTGKYVTYDGQRTDIANTGELRRYIDLTDTPNGNYSLWTFSQQTDGVYTIRNVAENSHIWDVRVDSYCVGTYEKTANFGSNQLFSFYDEEGQQVEEKTEVEPESDNGYNVSSWLVATEESLGGWDNQGGWFLNTGAGGSHYNGVASTEAPFIENWHDTFYGALGDCSLTQTLNNLPAGQYTLQADMISVWQGNDTGGWNWGQRTPEAHGTNVSLFANGQSTKASTGNNAPERYQVNFTLGSNGTVTLGVNVENTNANWIAIDNIVLYYNGTKAELIAGEKAKVRAELAEYYTTEEITEKIAEAGDDFDALETLRHSVDYMPKPDPMARVLKNLTINGHGIAYVESLDYYLYSTTTDAFDNGTLTATVNYDQSGGELLSIDGQDIEPGSEYTFQNVSAKRAYTFTVTNSTATVSQKVVFTSLPVVKLYGSFNNEYSLGSIIVYEPNQSQPFLLNMKAKWRGGITNSSGKNKRNYHVKLKNADGTKLETKFFGLRNDNSWILESCQVDMSRIRNRVLTDLWNDFSTPPYYKAKEKKARTGTRGQFVELVLNDEYRGIYCMTENMDRKQMQLKKIEEATEEKPETVTHGQLWKSKDWCYAVFMGPNRGHYQPADYLTTPDNGSDMWDKYQVKYPDFEDYGYQTDWQVLYNAVDFVCHSSDDDFREHFAEYFDLPVVIDYYILMETILSTDNHGKNMFFAVYDTQADKKITLGVWDMDATCGQRWSDAYYHWDGMQPEQDYAKYVYDNEHGDYNLFKRLRDTDTDNFNNRVRARYYELRKNYLATENILQRFSTYLNQFKQCGAAQREYDKWSYDSDVAGHELDFDVEMDYLTDWFTRRMNYLDDVRFDIENLIAVGIDDLQAKGRQQGVYTLDGRQVRTNATTKGLPAGVYVVNGRKVVVK